MDWIGNYEACVCSSSSSSNKCAPNRTSLLVLIPFSIYVSYDCVCIIPLHASLMFYALLAASHVCLGLVSECAATALLLRATISAGFFLLEMWHENMYGALPSSVCHYFPYNFDYILLHFTTMFIFTLMVCCAVARARERERIETWDHSIDRMLLAVCLCFTIRCFPSMSTHTTMPASIGYSFALALSVWESRRRFIIKVVRQTDDDGGEWTNKECECDLCCETVCERGMRVLWRVSSWIVGQWSIHFNIFIHDMMRERDRPWKEHRHTHTHVGNIQRNVTKYWFGRREFADLASDEMAMIIR